MNSIAGRMTGVSASVTAILGIFLLAGCPDDSADMARQLSQSAPRKGGAADTGAGGADRSAAGRQTGAAEPAGKEPEAGLPGKAGEAAEGEATEAPAGPELEAVLKEVKPPYPKFEGAGYYDIELAVTIEEAIPAKVWSVILLGADGKEVGKDQQLLVLVAHREKSFSFKKFYCSALPVAAKLEMTEKQAAGVPEEGRGSDAGKQGAGAGGGKQGAGAGGGKPGAGASGGGGDDEGGGAAGGE